MAVHRIVKARHAANAFDGEGARLAGGRWNAPGSAVAYTSQSLALAALETFIHLGDEGLGIRFVSFRIEIPAELAVQEVLRPPKDWRKEPPVRASMALGTAWLRSKNAVALSVPSAILPTERNLLLNPAHPRFHQLRISKPTPLVFDPRMWKA